MKKVCSFVVYGQEKQVFRFFGLTKATLCGAAIEMVYDLKLDDQVEHQYAKLVFLCMVCAIVVGVPVASSWVAYFGKVPLGVQLVRSTPDE